MKTTCILAIDVGSISGAYAIFFPSNPELINAQDLPVVANQVDPASFASRLEQLRPDVAVVERVGAMPKQGVSSTFKFGTANGLIVGVLAALKIPTLFVAPSVWKAHFRLGPDKEQARAMALQFWPACSDQFGLKKHHNRAEAALIARYGAERIVNGGAA